jgi:hypothetical protein
MYNTKNVQRTQVVDVGREGNKAYSSVRLVVGSVLWLLAVALMIALSLFAHTHPQPVPFELATSRDLHQELLCFRFMRPRRIWDLTVARGI